jgi:hypothetical protein
MSDHPASTASQPTTVATHTESKPTGAPTSIRRDPSQPTRLENRAGAALPLAGRLLRAALPGSPQLPIPRYPSSPQNPAV